MSAIEVVPVFFLNQDETWEQPCRVQPRGELRDLKKQGLGRFISNGRAFRLFESAPPLPALAEIEDAMIPLSAGETATTISVSEVLANVGIVSLRNSHPAATIMRAQEKVRAYPVTFDQRAVLAHRGWTPSL